jgi:alpha-L-fucosidase
MKKIVLFMILSDLIVLGIHSAQQNLDQYVKDPDPRVQKRLEEWQDLKFGLLMHWGPYSQWGVVESWSICSEDEPWCRRKSDNYVEYKKEYENLKTTFNPIHFNPDKWAEAAKRAGMRYMVFTTKHHDGFCMFDTKWTDYKVTDEGCPFSQSPRANITKEIFDAFRKQGFWIGAYFSKPDWHCEYYWWPYFATPDRNVNYEIDKYPERWKKFIEFTHGQVNELMSDYGRVDILWLDGGWVAPLTEEQITAYLTRPGYKFKRLQSQDIHIPELARKAREKQPGLIVVDRAVPGMYQNYLTPENRVPEEALPYPWESCIISGGGWSYTPDAQYKSAHELVHILVDVVSKGGNLLLNIAPGPEGTWQEDAFERLDKIGEWMSVNKEAIYGTRPISPYKEGKICLTQKHDGSVYAIYLADEDEKNPPAEIRISSIRPKSDTELSLLGVDDKIRWERAEKGFIVLIPDSVRRNPPCLYAWTLKISEIENR